MAGNFVLLFFYNGWSEILIQSSFATFKSPSPKINSSLFHFRFFFPHFIFHSIYTDNTQRGRDFFYKTRNHWNYIADHIVFRVHNRWAQARAVTRSHFETTYLKQQFVLRYNSHIFYHCFTFNRLLDCPHRPITN